MTNKSRFKRENRAEGGISSIFGKQTKQENGIHSRGAFTWHKSFVLSYMDEGNDQIQSVFRLPFSDINYVIISN